MKSLDVVLDGDARFGRYQTLALALLIVPASVMSSWNAYSMVFLAYPVEHYCASNRSQLEAANGNNNHNHNHNNSNGPSVMVDSRRYDDDDDDQCRGCDGGWTYDKTYFQSTVVTDWDLVCDRAIAPKIVVSLLGVAGVLGLLVFSHLQDAFGRKPAFLLSLTCYVLGGSLCVLATDLYWFTVIRAFAASQFDVCYNIAYIWALEYFGSSKRTVVNGSIAVAFGLAAGALSLVAWALPNWRHFALATSLPFVLCYSYAWLLHESPRWLMSRGRTREAAEVLEKISRFDGKRPSADLGLQLEALRRDELTGQSAERRRSDRPKFQDLFRGHNLRWKTLLITFTWFSNAVTYYSIAFNIENLSGDPLVTFAVQAVMEAPANVLNIVMVNKIGRVLPLTSSMFVSALCCFASAAVHHLDASLELVLVSVAKFCICISYNIMYQFSGELYPTSHRGLGMGFSCLFGNLGTIAMPYIVYSAGAYRTLPMIILGSITMLSACSSAFLPETMGEYMPQTAAEAEQYGLVGWSTVRSHWKRLGAMFRLKK